MAIDGFRVRISTEELTELLTKNIEHHAQRAEAYDKQAAALGEGPRTDSFLSFGSRAQDHRGHVRRLTFVRDHLIPEEEYRLYQHELNDVLVPEFD